MSTPQVMWDDEAVRQPRLAQKVSGPQIQWDDEAPQGRPDFSQAPPSVPQPTDPVLRENPDPSQMASEVGQQQAERYAPSVQMALGGGGIKNVAEGVGAAAKWAFPSVKRAGKLFEQVKSAAGSIPIDTSKVGDAAFETQRLAESGGQMPKVVRDFLRRSTAPGKAPINYSEARDFYSNATRLSADEAQRLTPVMRRQAGKFTQTLGQSIENAAGQVGQKQTLKDAMKEYSRAMGRQETKEKLIKGAKKYAIRTAGVGAGYGLFKEMTE